MVVQPESIPSGAEAPLVSAPNLQYRQNLSKLKPSVGDQPLQQFWMYSLAIGASRTFLCEAGVPSCWMVTVVPATGVQLNIWNGPNSGGDPIVIGGGGFFTFEASSEYVTIQSRLGTCLGNVIALRNMKVELNSGNVA